MVDFADKPVPELEAVQPGTLFVVRRGELMTQATGGMLGVVTEPSHEFDGDVLRVLERCGELLGAEIVHTARGTFGRRLRVSLDLRKIVIQIVPETYLYALTGAAAEAKA